MPHPASRRLVRPSAMRLAALASLAVGMLVLGVGPLPASAAEASGGRPPTTDEATTRDRQIVIQTQGLCGFDVRSVAIRRPDGSQVGCFRLLGRAEYLQHWFGATVRLASPGRYEVLSFDDDECTDSHYFAGSRGPIDVGGTFDRWTVYAKRPPKPSL